MADNAFHWQGKESPLLADPYFHSLAYKAYLKAHHANPDLTWPEFKAKTDKPVCQRKGRGAFLSINKPKELA